MKKVGVMTWYKYQNYGSALQACAMSYVIKKMGYTAEFINYEPQKAYVDKLTNKVLIKKIKITIEDIVQPKFQSDLLKQKFKRFMESRIVETKPKNTLPELSELNDLFDAFICGSDQIWSPNNFDDKYFLSFIKDSDKIIAYAPSIGLPQIANEVIKDRIGKEVKRIKYISLREKQGTQLVKSLYAVDAKTVLDPSLLLTSKEWDDYIEIDKCVENLEGDYILCYFLGNEKRYFKQVKKIAKILNLKPFIIPVFKKGKIKKISYEVGPEEFISLIKNAKYVCTDSYHGMLFSINYNIPFSVFKRFKNMDAVNQNSRINSILEILGLQKRIMERVVDAKIVKKCDFTNANSILENERKKSLLYLETALKEATEKERNFYSGSIADVCCGCGACAAVCPTQAIRIIDNEKGFQEYSIEHIKCINCGQCKTVCPFHHVEAISLSDKDYLYAVKSNDKKVLDISSSGGASYTISKLKNDRDYWISGAVYQTEDNRVKHILLPPKSNIIDISGLKYLQSRTADVFKEIDKLDSEDNLIFIGTPCQAAGMDNLLTYRGKRKNVLLMDLICHGVPTQYLWKNYIQQLNKKYSIGLNPNVCFRLKKKGWRKRYIEVSKYRTYVKNEFEDVFYSFFKNGLCNMEACFECPYRDKSKADIRLGDYWGNRFAKDKTGVSMVIPITMKGEQVIGQIQKECNVTVKQYEMIDFWENQYPKNMPKLLYYDELNVKLKNNVDLTLLMKEYCTAYKRQEILVKILNKLKRR